MYDINVNTADKKHPIVMTTESAQDIAGNAANIKTIISMNVTAAEDMISNLQRAIKMVKAVSEDYTCQSETTNIEPCQQ